MDHMVDFLAKEDEYWKRTVNDPRLWNEKKGEHDDAQERHKRKRMMLKHYLDRSKSNPDNDEDDNVSSSVEILREMTTITVASDIVSAPPFPSLPMSSNKPEKKRRRTRKSLLPHELCPTCNESKRHQDCSLRLCKWCCCESTEKCSLTDHNRSKVGARKPFTDLTNTIAGAETATTLPMSDIEQQMENAIQAKQAVFIQYDTTLQPREIKPTRSERKKNGLLIHALCVKKNEDRSFYTYKIKRLEDHDWTKPDTVPVQGICLTYWLLIKLIFFYCSKTSVIRAVAGVNWPPTVRRQFY